MTISWADPNPDDLPELRPGCRIVAGLTVPPFEPMRRDFMMGEDEPAEGVVGPWRAEFFWVSLPWRARTKAGDWEDEGEVARVYWNGQGRDPEVRALVGMPFVHQHTSTDSPSSWGGLWNVFEAFWKMKTPPHPDDEGRRHPARALLNGRGWYGDPLRAYGRPRGNAFVRAPEGTVETALDGNAGDEFLFTLTIVDEFIRTYILPHTWTPIDEGSFYDADRWWERKIRDLRLPGQVDRFAK